MESYCNFYAFTKFGIKTLGIVSVPPTEISGIITSLNSSSHACLAVISNIKMPSISAIFPPVYLEMAQEKAIFVGIFFHGENVRKKQKMTPQSRSTYQALACSET